MNKSEKDEKNKEGISNFLTLVSVVLIICGIVIVILGQIPFAFILCLTGTILTFVSSYIKNGYFTFFNN
jgi:hypothetical protein